MPLGAENGCARISLIFSLGGISLYLGKMRSADETNLKARDNETTLNSFVSCPLKVKEDYRKSD